MSAGEFLNTRYVAEYNSAQIHPIKVQPETTELSIDSTDNTPTTSAITSPISAMVSGGKRELGLHASMVSFKFTGTIPSDYKAGSIIRLPLLNAAIRAKAVKGATGAYIGGTIEVVSNYSPEIVR